MAESNLNQARSNLGAAAQAGDRVSPEKSRAQRLPPQERNQPDPVLQMSIGRVGGGAVAFAAVICAIILGVVLYGLDSPTPNPQMASAPPPASFAPAAGGISGAAIPRAPQTNDSGHS